MKKELIRIEHVTKDFRDSNRRRVRAVDDLSLSIYEGETFGLVGESGCGKSTTGNLLVRLLKANQGKIFYKGTEISGISEREFAKYRREIQMVFQDPYGSINPRKKIGWLLEEPLKIHRKDLSAEERRRMAERMLEVVGLDKSFGRRYPKALSGGQRQRVSIALALILNPSFVVADEPVSALDVSIQAQILNLLASLKKEFSLTLLFISHDLNVVSYLSDRIGIMYLGNLVEVGRVELIERGAAHPYTRALFSASERESGRGPDEPVLTGDVPSPSDPPAGCPFHTRCPYCQEVCRREKPVLREIEEGWSAACHFPFSVELP